MTRQEERILWLWDRMAETPHIKKPLRDFYIKQAAEFRQRAEKRAENRNKPEAEPPKAFTKFLEHDT